MAADASAFRALIAVFRRIHQRRWWLLAVLITLAAAFLPPMQRANLFVYDLLASSVAPGDSLVLVAIDEASVARIGQWPWPRDVHARLLERLKQGNATVAAFAVLFSEAQERAGGEDTDAAFAGALASFGNVVLPVAPVDSPNAGQALGRKDRMLTELRPLQRFRTSVDLAHADLEIDIDGVVRRVHLFGGIEQPLPALSLALARAAVPDLASRPLAGLRSDAGWGSKPGVWFRDFEVMLPHRSQPPQVWSYIDALQSDAFIRAVTGRAVLIGATARGLGPELPLAGPDNYSAQPVVFAHAHAYEAIVADALVTPTSLPASLAMSLVVLLGLLAMLPRRDGRLQQATVVMLVIAPLAMSFALLSGADIWWGPVPALLGMLAAGASWFVLHLSESVQSVRRAHDNASATLDSIGDAVLSVDDAGRIVYANASARAFSQLNELEGKAIGEVFEFDQESGLRLEAMIQRCQARREIVRDSEHLHLLGSGLPQRSLSATVAPLTSRSGQTESMVVAFTDLTDSVASAQQLSHAATHDQLTGLPNRSLLRDRVTQSLAVAKGKSRLAVLFVDLDRFKRINQGLGHRMGDEVLKVTANRLLGSSGAGDTVARWGGNEFVLVLGDAPSREAISEIAQDLVERLGREIPLEGVVVACSASIGIATSPEDGDDADELLAKADAAMHRAKSRAGAHFEFYSSGHEQWTRDRLALELELRQGMARGELELHYQPQIRLRDGRLIGFEALMRWRRSDGQLLQPGAFIGLAEESGLIVDLGAWALKEVVSELARMREASLRPVPIAINLSPRQFQDRQIIDHVNEALAAGSVNPSLIALEITENTAMADPELASELVAELVEMGVRVSIDDFGTGYSSLLLLRRIPIAEVKIDRSFVQGMTESSDDAAIVRATIALGQEMGLRVIAEGVETAQQQAFLIEHGCDAAQGFLYGRAVSATAARRMLAARPSPSDDEAADFDHRSFRVVQIEPQADAPLAPVEQLATERVARRKG